MTTPIEITTEEFRPKFYNQFHGSYWVKTYGGEVPDLSIVSPSNSEASILTFYEDTEVLEWLKANIKSFTHRCHNPERQSHFYTFNLDNADEAQAFKRRFS